MTKEGISFKVCNVHCYKVFMEVMHEFLRLGFWRCSAHGYF